jgi:hypothetical protein
MKKPILVISNYRTGSTSYSAKLARDNNLMWFPEPHLTPDTYNKLQELITSGSTGFVVKFMADQIDSVDAYQTLLKTDSHKVKLLRRNVEDQILSHYVASITGIWNTLNQDKFDPYRVSIDNIQLRNSINIINESRKMLDNLECTFDEVIYYEDLGMIENHPDFRMDKIQPPSNIEHIRMLLRNNLNRKSQQ